MDVNDKSNTETEEKLTGSQLMRKFITIFKLSLFILKSDPKKYYVGITDDPYRRLFTDHAVAKINDKCIRELSDCAKETKNWIYLNVHSDAVARSVENYFLEKGLQGGPKGGSDASVWVYIFLLTNSTKPSINEYFK